jgi:hypothetical protein
VRSALVYELRDDIDLASWQAGLERADGFERPSFRAIAGVLGVPMSRLSACRTFLWPVAVCAARSASR